MVTVDEVNKSATIRGEADQTIISCAAPVEDGVILN